MTIHQLIYTSDAIPDMNESTLIDILNISQVRNSEHKISGILILHRGSFLQLLEGEEQDVREIYSSIVRDHRHTNVRLLLEADCAARSMPAWVMGFSTSVNTSERIRNHGFHISFEEVKEICALMEGNTGELFQKFIN